MTATRGTSNQNERGSAEQRRKRKVTLMEDYEANVRALVDPYDGFIWETRRPAGETGPNDLYVAAACRCYRCGRLLTIDTVTVDRIIPGCLGGTYARNNIRPACSQCNTETGAPMANSKAHRVAKLKARILKRTCAHCKASKGHRCTDPTGKSMSTFHAPRRAAA